MMGWHGNILDYAMDWWTPKPHIIRVEAGRITGVAEGTTEVYAQCGSKRAGATITVTGVGTTAPPAPEAPPASDPTPPPGGASAIIALPSTFMIVGQTIVAKVVLQDANTNALPIVGTPAWSSSNEGVARVDASGQITGVARGTFTVRVIANGVTGSANIEVGGSGPEAPPTSPPPPTTPTSPPIVNVPDGSGVTATAPELPRSDVPDAQYVPPSGQTIRVSSGGDLQGALNAAQPGDQVLLAAGAQFVGNFVLPPKATGESCGAWVTVTTETSLPPAGTRVTPSSAASFAKIITPNQDASIKTVGRGSCYRIVGVELTILSSWGGLNYALTMFGDEAFTSLSQIPHGIVLDRVYIHGQSNTNTVRCVALNSARSAIINSWLTDCHTRASDSQAIEGWNGPGPYLIENNFIAAAGENIMFGGADPRVSGMTPSDITIRRNHIWKDPSWKGQWVVKNLFELKHARRVLLEGNVLENNWADGQSGMAIVLKTLSDGATAPWTTTADVTIRYNIIRNSPRGFNVQGMDGFVGTPVARVRLEHNLFENIGTYNGTQTGGWHNLITHTPSDIAIVHNTMTNNTAFGLALMMDYGNRGAQRLQMDDNVFTNPTGYALFYSGMPVGSAAMTAMAGSSWSYSRNVTVGVASDIKFMHPTSSWYPSMSEAGFANPGGGDYRLSFASPFKGKAGDGRDPGVDYDELNRRTAGVVVR